MPSPIRIKYLGWSSVILESKNGSLAFDPFFRRLAGAKWASVDEYSGVKVICLTHGHAEHYLDTPRVVKATGAMVVSSKPICNHLHRFYGIPINKLIPVEPLQDVAVGDFTITPFNWYHRKINYMRFFMGDFYTGLYFSFTNLVRCPYRTPYYGFCITTKDGLRLMNCSEGINSLFPFDKVREMARRFEPSILIAGAQLNYENEVARAVEVIGPKTFITYHPHERVFAKMNIQSTPPEVFDKKVKDASPQVKLFRPDVLSTLVVS